MIDSTLYRCTGCGALVIGARTCGDPARPECAKRCEPWCTDHVTEDPGDVLSEGADDCVAVFPVLPAGGGWGAVEVTISQALDGTGQPLLTVESYSRLMTVAEAEHLHEVLGRALDEAVRQP